MEYLSEILSFIGGVISGGFAMRIYYVKNSNKVVAQSDIVVGGDFAGRDMKK
jgi:hypothetical protein